MGRSQAPSKICKNDSGNSADHYFFRFNAFDPLQQGPYEIADWVT